MNHSAAFVPALLALASLAAPVAAQNFYPLAYPQATTAGSSGNILPFGVLNSSTNFDEARYQILIPSTHMPTTRAAIVGLEVNSQVWTGTLTYASYDIALSNTTATSLSPVYATNLVAPTNVFSGTNVGISFTSRQWAPVTFSTPFIHNGSDALVIDLRKVIDRTLIPVVPGVVTMETTGNPGRLDLPTAIGSFGAFGSGASNSSTAAVTYSSILQVRLIVQDVPTVELLSDRGGPSNYTFAIGSSADVNLHSISGSPFAVFVESGFMAPIPLPPISGNLIIAPITVLFSGSTGAGDVASVTVPIPNLNLLIGGYFTFQGIAVQNGSPFFTNGADAYING